MTCTSVGDAHCKNRPSSLMKYKGILQLMQSMRHFLAVRPHRVCFLGGGGTPAIYSQKGGLPRYPKKRDTRGIFAVVASSHAVGCLRNRTEMLRTQHAAHSLELGNNALPVYIHLCSTSDSITTRTRTPSMSALALARQPRATVPRVPHPAGPAQVLPASIPYSSSAAALYLRRTTYIKGPPPPPSCFACILTDLLAPALK